MGAILITGATGFLGSNLCRRYLGEGSTVVGLRRPTSELSRIQACLQDSAYIDLVIGKQLPSDIKCESLIHTATCYGRNGESIDDLENANIRLPLRLISELQRSGLRRFINIDSTLPADTNEYARSKLEFKIAARQLCAHLAIDFVNVRLEYMYGPGDDSNKFPMHVIRECLRNAAVLRLSPGDQLRDFIYVEDAVDAVMTIERARSGGSASCAEYDVGSGTTTSLRVFAETVKALARANTRLEFGALPYRIKEVMYSNANIRKLKGLGWSPKYELKSGLEITIAAERNR